MAPPFSQQSQTADFINITQPLSTSPSQASHLVDQMPWQVELELADGITLRLRRMAAYIKDYNLERLHTTNGDLSSINYEKSQKNLSGWA